MPETFALVSSFFGSGAAAGAAGAGAAGAGAGAAAAGAGAAAAGAGAAAGLGSTILTAAGAGLAAAAVGKLLEPSPPGLPKPTPMADPLAQQEARRRSLVEQTARRGRASTILTADAGGSGKLGG